MVNVCYSYIETANWRRAQFRTLAFKFEKSQGKSDLKAIFKIHFADILISIIYFLFLWSIL